MSEVQAELPRQRISIQGWFHGEAPLPSMHALPSLGVIKALSAVEWLAPAESSPSSEVNAVAGSSPRISPMYTSSEGTIHAQLAQMLMQQQSANLGQFLVNPPPAVSTDSEAHALEKKNSGKVWPGRARGTNPIVERFVRLDPLISLDEITDFVAKLLGAVEGLEVRVADFSPDVFHSPSRIDTIILCAVVRLIHRRSKREVDPLAGCLDGATTTLSPQHHWFLVRMHKSRELTGSCSCAF